MAAGTEKANPIGSLGVGRVDPLGILKVETRFEAIGEGTDELTFVKEVDRLRRRKQRACIAVMQIIGGNDFGEDRDQIEK